MVEILDTRVKVLSTHTHSQTPKLAKDNICYLLPDFGDSLQLNINDILSSIELDKHITGSNRYTAYYGNLPYSFYHIITHIYHLPYNYSYAHHEALSLSESPVIKTCLDAVNEVFQHAEVNSVLVNYYPDGSSKINFHSDDEDDIDDNSFIFTLSFGHSRTIIFRTLERKKHVAKISLKDRSILLFSKASQHLFQHAILPETGVSERISLTFRKLKDKSVY